MEKVSVMCADERMYSARGVTQDRRPAVIVDAFAERQGLGQLAR